ncbi:MAG: hypothetical protein WC532_00525 [Candidatus Omnitrophota bacterium]
MRLSRFLLTVSLVTSFSLLYVYQQSEIFRLAYAGQKRVTRFEDLLDKNAGLKYNIAKNVSLTRIGSKVAADPDFQMPDSYRLIKLSRPLNGLKVTQYAPKKETLLSRLFGIKRQAEAALSQQ